MLYKAMDNIQLSHTLNLSVGMVIDTETLSETDKASVMSEVRLNRGLLRKISTPDTEEGRKAVAAATEAANELMSEADEALREAATVRAAAEKAIAEAAQAKLEAEEAIAAAVKAKQEAEAAKEEAEVEEKAAKKAAKKAKEEAEAVSPDAGPIPKRSI